MTSDAPVTLRFYDTFTREKREFTPLDANNVRMYVCGPTVYDYAHIGNARPVIVFDVLFRLLRHVYGPDHVTYVRNITDVDDKINARAARDYPGLPLNEAIRRVTEKTANQFQKDAEALGCLEPTFQPRATENIAQMQEMIATLIQKGNAYEAGGEVLFDTASMPAYGGLSKRNLDEQQAGARVEVADHKRNPADFVLWKQSTAEEPGWDSPWGRGRPGWHIECSAMSDRYLWGEVEAKLSGEARAHPHQFDIHGGGLDLIFPHHENEIAQSCCAHGVERMAQFWMHNGFLQVEGQKMSKSLGNFVTIHDLLETEKFGQFTWPGQVLRYAMLMTHYREPIDFSVKRLEEAALDLGKYSRFIAGEAVGELPSKFVAALSDDLNTPAAISFLRSLASSSPVLAQVTRPDDDGFVDASSNLDADTERRAQLAACLEFLGIDMPSFDPNWITSSIPENRVREIQKQVDARLEALNAKDFAKADAIRADLLTKGVQLMDYKDPDSGERRTKWEIKS